MSVVHMSQQEFDALGLTPPPAPPAATPASLPVASVSAPPATPTVRPLSLRKALKPRTQAFNVIDAALRLSGATNGAPIVRRVRAGYVITVNDHLRYGVDTSQPLATVITVRAAGTQTTTRYPAISASEWCSLFLVWKP